MTITHLAVEDRLAIQELSAQYAFRCDTKRYDEVAELFTEDGTWDETVIGMPLAEGRAAIHEFFCSMAQADLEWLIHVNANHSIAERGDDAASGTCHLHCRGRFNGADIEIFGYYDDEYAKVDGVWRFRRRRLVEIAPTTGLG